MIIIASQKLRSVLFFMAYFIFFQATNGSEILETTVDKATVQSRCQVNVRALKTNLSDIEGISGDVLNFYLKFHLENGTLVPLDVSNDSDGKCFHS